METNVPTYNGYEKLAQFLKNNESTVLDLWEKSIVVSTDEDDKELIRKNGFLIYQLIIDSILDDYSDDDIKSLAHKVAQERADANINIGDFVYNVNLGRSLIVKHIIKSGILLDELQPIIDLVNRQFDRFCYYAVSKYTELKDMKLKEINLFISQSHKDRLSILGQMSSSFVHEFRNPLTSVMGFVKLLKAEHPSMPYLDIISKELEQLKFRITQFLHTSKMNTVIESRIETITINDILEDVVHFLYPSIVDSNIEVTTNMNLDVTVNGDRNELKQVFLNLLINAVDALSEEKEKKRKINIIAAADLDNISVSISNNGAPLSADEIKLIFEPFYSTKNLGTGIGLYVCKKIIESHHGTINCISTDDLTTFQVMLPINFAS
ncbi:histidine kinase N-terminal domain-containing protein [Schinkia azotoformans]|uniref:histidine kinase n=1 Tax=Schinkia azotoformans LMG 9581 TaxID=1131731 RepID=K6DI53_SCHAZ|nr:histidine kinase N-terminal domain-containing protein [Schinkia azotoformans]EKN67798.1 histidine kinase [Schinkia azotoformans LMG 9581]MEC1637438.1 histidine kinase N-terminal domain-containing protein [Schinkia azotoformans]MEC1943842.1 histidine kinase N-terminal domain-containing protein [Schinkia azotoformans]